MQDKDFSEDGLSHHPKSAINAYGFGAHGLFTLPQKKVGI
jgi:hypothetical protein